MGKKKSGRNRKTTKVRDLPAPKGPGVKGGFSALSQVVKNVGDALQTAARKG
jgi:hypothetical protein